MAIDVATRLALRPMTATDIAVATDLSREQGWPHSEDDWKLFLELGEGIVATLDGKFAGTVLAWRFATDMATIGLVIVARAAQGMGIGRQLMEAMLERLKGRTVVLNATDEGLPLYRKLGFVETGSIHQHQGRAPVVPLVNLVSGERVRPMGAADDSLGALYSRSSGMDRRALFDALAGESDAVVLARDHVPVGFALFRRFGRGWSIAPVVAPDLGGAKALVSHWLGTKTNRFCRLDVDAAGGMSEWLEELGLPKVGRVVTMALGSPPVGDGQTKVFGLAAQALG
ncbi:MAG: GNAT family N-acetyltransferase [Sphingomicrobium sp.]